MGKRDNVKQNMDHMYILSKELQKKFAFNIFTFIVAHKFIQKFDQ